MKYKISYDASVVVFLVKDNTLFIIKTWENSEITNNADNLEKIFCNQDMLNTVTFRASFIPIPGLILSFFNNDTLVFYY